MGTYYKPEDLPKFGEIGQEAQGLAQKFFDCYGAVWPRGNSRKGGRLLSPCPWSMSSSVLIASFPTVPEDLYL
jgi:hypothetical protein